LKLFGSLGYRPTAVVKKRRRIYEWPRDGFTIHACLDDVDGVGRFVELEIVVDDAHYPAARDTVLRIAAELALGPTEPRSYLEQLLGRAVTPGGERSEPEA
jgi:predicted adenylyl cyclase CyaB